jgi:hypothetical protein
MGYVSIVHVSAEELLIDFKEIIGQHNGENLAEAVWGTLELYGITDKACVRFLFQMEFPNGNYWFRLLRLLWTTQQTTIL